MHASEFVFCIVKILFFLCTCSHAEFGYFQVQRNCHCHSLYLCLEVAIFLLLTVRHSMDAFGYLEQKKKTLTHSKSGLPKMPSLCVQDGTDIESFYFIVETMITSWGNSDSDSYGYNWTVSRISHSPLDVWITFPLCNNCCMCAMCVFVSLLVQLTVVLLLVGGLTRSMPRKWN